MALLRVETNYVITRQVPFFTLFYSTINIINSLNSFTPEKRLSTLRLRNENKTVNVNA